MTGTADTEAYEFQQIYGLEVVVIPTNQPMIRKDNGDLVYLTQKEKYEAIVADIQDCVTRGQPVLVGTASIETSELVDKLLIEAKIPHEVLNAKQHEREAGIVAQAGRPGAVTIATNMAGRGTDIVLGGNLEAELEQAGPDADREAIRAAWKDAPRAGHRRRRAACGRHRAPRVPAHRQPVARALRAPGRPRLQPLLSVAGRQPDAHLRLRAGRPA